MEGFTDNFIGLGLLEEIISGSLAGKAIAEGLNYEQLVEPLVRLVRRRFAFREALNTLDDTGSNRLLRVIALPELKQAIYNTNIDIISLLYPHVKNYYEKKSNRPDDRLDFLDYDTKQPTGAVIYDALESFLQFELGTFRHTLNLVLNPFPDQVMHRFSENF
ncbi:MAG: hypothetical protein A4E53_01013 [Pelotomaculum sp. PtaB.Bin104]|nr:MAG: hypothetical protein A4E53_01013 [Pelotomaculum sp. PtaB.Bin104]